MEEVVLGIDLGTSAIKIIAVNRQGEVLETVSEPLKLFQEQPGYSEQDLMNGFKLLSVALSALSLQML